MLAVVLLRCFILATRHSKCAPLEGSPDKINIKTRVSDPYTLNLDLDPDPGQDLL